jgi:hypothetical protein
VGSSPAGRAKFKTRKVFQNLSGLARWLPRNRRSAYIRRVLSGAPVEVLDDALKQESDMLTSALDGAWDEDWDDA